MNYKVILLIFAQLHEIRCARSALEQLETLRVQTKKWMIFHLNATWNEGGLDLERFKPGRLDRILTKDGFRVDARFLIV